MIELEEISRNLLNSDFEPNNMFNSLHQSSQLSDKELDNLLSSGFRDVGNKSSIKVSEKNINSLVSSIQKNLENPLDELSKDVEGLTLKSKINENNTLVSEIQEGSSIRNKFENSSSIGSSLIKGSNVSDLKVLTSEIGEFDTGNYLGGIDSVINSQEVLMSKGDLDEYDNKIPETQSDEDSDEGDFIDRRSRIEKVKNISNDEKQIETSVQTSKLQSDVKQDIDVKKDNNQIKKDNIQQENIKQDNVKEDKKNEIKNEVKEPEKK